MAFHKASATEIGVKIHKGGKVSVRAGIFVVEWLLKEGLHEDSELVL